MNQALAKRTHDLDFRRCREAFQGIEPWQGIVRKGQLANFLGVLTSLDYLAEENRAPHAYARSAPYRMRTRLPEVADGDEFFEWVDVLEAVRAAEGSFTMIELGAGFAPRSVNAHAALQHLNPLPASLVVVEGLPRHFAWARQHFSANGIDPNDHWFVNAVVNATGAPELFSLAPGRYCNSIIPPETRRSVAAMLEEGGRLDVAGRSFLVDGQIGRLLRFNDAERELPVDLGFLSATRLGTVMQPLDMVDYMDVDIQFAEISVIPDAIEAIEKKVKLLHIGTHSSEIHADLRSLFEARGWTVLFGFEPYGTHETEYGSFKTTDGILTVRNPRFS